MKFTLELVVSSWAQESESGIRSEEKSPQIKVLFAVEHDTIHTINRFISFN